jgi:wobble nucleotide-excising tRNase
MKIERIKKIKNHRVFRDFSWTNDLPDFNEKNVFYGWNGTGKTTLCNLFRAIEEGNNISEGEVVFVIDGRDVNGAELSISQRLPEVRVFNKYFIEANVFRSEGALPIYIIGKKSIEKEKEVKQLKNRLEEETKALPQKEDEKKRADKELSEFTTNYAKHIKDLLSSSGGYNPYNNYNKSLFREKCDELLLLSEEERDAKRLSEDDFENLKKQKDATPKDKISPFDFEFPDTQKLTDQVNALLAKTVVSKVIEALKNDGELSDWVKNGLEKHKKENSTHCLFCDQLLPEGRMKELEAHFNDQYNEFIVEKEALEKKIQTEIKKVESCMPPYKSQFYEDLERDYIEKCQKLQENNRVILQFLGDLLATLEEKGKKPFQQIKKNFEVVSGNEKVLLDINEIIRQHNQRSDDFKTSIFNARESLENSLVLDSLVEYSEKKDFLKNATSALDDATERIQALEKKITLNENDIVEFRKPAVELNADICSYLGRDEITFDVQGTGYQINRNGKPAENLCEGETAAIAFLYFLKSLEDKSFSLKDGIVVIDDPVSSLDSNSIFHAFGMMKEKTKDAGQLIILTHSHSFFRQVKNWFNGINRHKPEKKWPGQFYMLKTGSFGRTRTSSIAVIDPLLRKYESEYHYLFSLIYKAATSTETVDLERYYPLPNIARRLLESFCAFRKPLKTGNLLAQLDCIGCDCVKKTRVIRFLHTYSHAEQYGEPEHDLSILLETRGILNDLLSMIESEDPQHFNEMKELVSG